MSSIIRNFEAKSRFFSDNFPCSFSVAVISVIFASSDLLRLDQKLRKLENKN